MRKNGTAAVVLAVAMALAAASPSYAQQAPPPGWQPPSNIDLYGGVGFKACFFDDWRALPRGTDYEFGYITGVEGGMRLFMEPWYFTVGFEGWIGHAEVTGTNIAGNRILNEEDFMAYGICARLGNGSINYNFAFVTAGGYWHIDEEISTGGATIASGDDDNWYARIGFTFERVLFGAEYGFRVWMGLDLDYTWTGIKDRLDGKDFSFYGFGIRIFFTF
jgi:hypothetical protein